jgi:arylsulfatase A-like enzyme
MDRREFLQRTGAVAAGGMLANLGILDKAAAAAAQPGTRPNIVFILVDEMRFPTAFPAGIDSPEQYLERYMPNLAELWKRGVVFDRYYSAGNACSPARATLATGLYPHQEWLLATRTAAGPALQTAFPTYGKLLRRFGYSTPYIGKWHLSNPPENGGVAGYLEDYGFQGFTNPDPVGTNGQGTDNDGNITDQAVRWLERNARGDAPFCLTVSFVNPHDRQFFWAGSEGDAYEAMFEGQTLQPFVKDYHTVASEANPEPQGFPAVPPNWEPLADLAAHGKPDSQAAFRAFQEAVWGGGTDDAGVSTFAVQPSPTEPSRLGVGIAPYSYWQRGSDMYTLVQTMVDEQIGKVIAAVPEQQLGNTVFVFASDHGEYAGAHGLLSGKIGSAYEEAIRIPLIVVDPSRRFARGAGTTRHQLVSSVDLAPMLVTLGNRGSDSWIRGDLRRIYGERLDVARVLRNARARGRTHVLFATDEVFPAALNPAHTPTHILAVRTPLLKLVTYSHWAPGTTRPIRASLRTEFYDYRSAAGRAETRSRPDDPTIPALLRRLFNQWVPQQMEAPLPVRLRRSVARARAGYLAFQALANAYSYKQLIDDQKLRTELGYGDHF